MVELLRARRVVARPEVLDRVVWPEGSAVMRLAPDDVLLLGEGMVVIDDPHAIVADEPGFSAVELDETRVLEILGRHAGWEPPTHRPCLAQGMVAGLPLKVWFDQGRALLIVPTPFAHELEDRLR